MSVVDRIAHVIPRSPARVPAWLRLAAVPLVAGAVLLGVWVTSGLITDKFRLAQALTGLFFAAAGAIAVVVGLRWRALAVPVIATYLVTSVAVGGFLQVTSTRDVVATGPVTSTGAPGSRVLGSGPFSSGAHETSGTARILATADGSRVLTLTGFATDPGPDLRVYLVPRNGSPAADGVDLGGLKGNRGDQEYEVPASLDSAAYGSVVIWCRAFTVAFGSAELSTPPA